MREAAERWKNMSIDEKNRYKPGSKVCKLAVIIIIIL